MRAPLSCSTDQVGSGGKQQGSCWSWSLLSTTASTTSTAPCVPTHVCVPRPGGEAVSCTTMSMLLYVPARRRVAWRGVHLHGGHPCTSLGRDRLCWLSGVAMLGLCSFHHSCRTFHLQLVIMCMSDHHGPVMRTTSDVHHTLAALHSGAAAAAAQWQAATGGTPVPYATGMQVHMGHVVLRGRLCRCLALLLLRQHTVDLPGCSPCPLPQTPAWHLMTGV